MMQPQVQEQCRVCGDPAAGFHFGVFTCEGCKSFFGRAHQKKLLAECKNKGNCDVNKNTRTKCKLCRLQKCLAVGMSKEASRYGRRSTYFKVHCMAENQAKLKKCKTERSFGGDGEQVECNVTVAQQQMTTLNFETPLEKISPDSVFPTRPVPCYPTLPPFVFNRIMYLYPPTLSPPFPSSIMQAVKVEEEEEEIPQSAPLDLSQKSSRRNKESTTLSRNLSTEQKSFFLNHSNVHVPSFVA